MKKKLILLLILTLTLQLSFSQNGYPRKVVINQDTVVAITPGQLTEINLLIIENEKNETINDSLFSMIDLLNNSLLLKNKACNELIFKNNQYIHKERIYQAEAIKQANTIKKQSRKITRNRIFIFSAFILGAIISR